MALLTLSSLSLLPLPLSLSLLSDTLALSPSRPPPLAPPLSPSHSGTVVSSQGDAGSYGGAERGRVLFESRRFFPRARDDPRAVCGSAASLVWKDGRREGGESQFAQEDARAADAQGGSDAPSQVGLLFGRNQ